MKNYKKVYTNKKIEKHYIKIEEKNTIFNSHLIIIPSTSIKESLFYSSSST